MKMIITGEANKEDMIELARFLRKRWENRKEHINVFMQEGTDDMSLNECLLLFAKVWED